MRDHDDLATDPLSRVREGMPVVDATGEEVGRVDLVQLGDPEAATTAGNEDLKPGPIQRVAEVLAPNEREPDVPEPLRSRLVRSGYIKIDGANLLDADRYVSGEHVREVSAWRVRLDLPKEQTPTEQ